MSVKNGLTTLDGSGGAGTLNREASSEGQQSTYRPTPLICLVALIYEDWWARGSREMWSFISGLLLSDVLLGKYSDIEDLLTS